MKYRIIVPKSIGKVLDALPEADFHRLLARVEALETNPRPSGVKKLKGKDGWRIRVGDYRVVYQIRDEEKFILLTKIGHRKDVYQ